jgi:hypothetical protein
MIAGLQAMGAQMTWEGEDERTLVVQVNRSPALHLKTAYPYCCSQGACGQLKPPEKGNELYLKGSGTGGHRPLHGLTF